MNLPIFLNCFYQSVFTLGISFRMSPSVLDIHNTTYCLTYHLVTQTMWCHALHNTATYVISQIILKYMLISKNVLQLTREAVTIAV